ncbi:MAG: NUDIX domain-containing protein [Pseudonocardiaceae bacterium]
MSRLVARIWRGLRGPAQWWILWAAHAQFVAGITGLVRNDAGRVLLLRHRFWPPQHQWGLPTGYAKRRETFEATIVREVKEETGLDVTVGPLLQLTSGYQLRVEVAYAAQLVGGELKLDPLEVLEAGWFPVTELPAGILPAHRQLIETNANWRIDGAATAETADERPDTERDPARRC